MGSHIREILSSGRPTISLEFFPPRTAEAEVKFTKSLAALSACKPAFASVTYGAGGSTRGLTRRTVTRVRESLEVETIPHLTCTGHSRAEIAEILTHYVHDGVANVLALRGDAPRGGASTGGEFRHAAELVRLIRENPSSTSFGIGVAGFPEGHPDTPNRMLEMDHLKAKIDAGADYICTQLFFDNRDFHDFRDRCELAGIRVPILAGILPVTSISGMQRMASLAGGTRFPARLLRLLQRVQDDPAAVERAGIHYATGQCADLLDQEVSGIHFYTLNQAGPVLGILGNLGLRLGV